MAKASKEGVWKAIMAMATGAVRDNTFSCTQMAWLDLMTDTNVIEAVALPLNEVGGVGYHIVNTTTDDKCGYLCVAFDMSALPGQGLEFNDFLLIGEYDPSRAPRGAKTYKDRWRWGVINYSPDRKTIRDIDWDNPYWGNAGGHGYQMLREIGPPMYVWVERKLPENKTETPDGLHE